MSTDINISLNNKGCHHLKRDSKLPGPFRFRDAYHTKRDVVPEAEKILGKEIKCLDQGFIRLVDYMGGDDAIVQAARVSYGKGTKNVNQDRGLIRYLMRHRHTTPFEMVEMKWHCKMPIFVARQWIRHRTANVNEYSLRYSEPRDEFYVPNMEDIRFQSVTNKQGGEEREVPEEVAKKVIDIISTKNDAAFSDYEFMNEEGIARELARIGLPVSLYTEWYWKNDLHNTLHFLGLRMDDHAQYEIRNYANAMAHIVKKVAPIAYEAFEDYVLNSEHLSGLEIKALRDISSGKSKEEVLDEFTNKRERNEFESKLERIIGNY